MATMLQRHCARYIYVVPDGLRELMSDISREVLRNQPKDYYSFIADYLDALIITRENARVATRLVQSLTELATTTAIFLEETGMPMDEIENIVHAIQTTFRKSIESDTRKKKSLSQDVEEEAVVTDVLTEIDVSPDQAEVAAVVIQQAYKRFKERKEREKQLLAGRIDWRAAARSAIHLYRRTGVTDEEVNRAATLIKAAYKGYYTRKIMKANLQEQGGPMKDFSESQSLEYPDYPEEELVDDSHDKGKVVKIDYKTVIPHVAFDSQAFIAPLQSEEHGRISTSSGIVKHSIKYLFDSVLEKIGIQTTIMEESSVEVDQEDNMPADLIDKRSPVETETRQDNLDIADKLSSEIDNTDIVQEES